METTTYQYLTPEALTAFVSAALREDVGDGDHSTLSAVPASAQRRARLLIKDDGIIAGVALALHIFAQVDPALQVYPYVTDGQPVTKGMVGLEVEGPARSILTAERLVLNCMQRMSGIATYTHQLNSLIAHTKARLLDTRKTTPNARLIEKWAVRIGGGTNHRFGLFDMIMLKDNHVDYAGGVTKAIEAAVAYRQAHQRPLRIEVETRNLDEVREALATGAADVIMLDNMPPTLLRQAVALIAGQVITEASGGITEKTIREVAETGVDFISIGALTHSYRSIDISLKAV